MNIIERIKGILPEQRDRKPLIVLLLAPVIFTIWKYQGSPEFFDKHLSNLFNPAADLAFLRIVYYGVLSLLLLFLVPSLIVKWGFKEKLSDYGFNLRDIKFGSRFILLALPVVWLLMLPTAYDPEYQALNPMYQDAGRSVPVFVLYAFVYFLYYIGWEFFFRGFILFGIRERVGDLYAVLIQTIPSVIAHIGRPEGEMISSIIAGIVFGFLVLRSRTIWYVLILHWFIGLSMDIMCIIVR
jgi:membrane protease YdiL (CAAX protease family)